MENIEVNEIISTNSSNNEYTTQQTFDKLLEIQDLLKKESALKELCKQIYNIFNYHLIIYSP